MAEEGENKVEIKVAAPKTVDFTFRMTILVLLAVQNAAHALMSRYSKVILSIIILTISAHFYEFKYLGNLEGNIF